MFEAQKRVIADAISGKKLLQFTYDNSVRVVEPHQLGLTEANHLGLNAYWIRGYSESQDTGNRWRTYLVQDMRFIAILDELFSGPRSGFKRGPNKKFHAIVAEL